MPNATAEEARSSFIRGYNTRTGFWNITKQRALSLERVAKFRDALKVLNNKAYLERWDNATQRAFAKELYSKGHILFFKTPGEIDRYKKEIAGTSDSISFVDTITRLYKRLVGESGAQAANARIIRSLANRLGLLRSVRTKSFFTPMGFRFLAASKKEELVEIVATQMAKWLYWNPSLKLQRDRSFRLFPFRFVASVCHHLDDNGVTTREMALFLMKSTEMTQVEDAVRTIQWYRALSTDEKAQLKKNCGPGKLTTIQGYVSYICSVFELTGLFTYDRDASKLTLLPKAEIAKRILNESATFFRYENEDLYYAYFGSPDLTLPHREVRFQISAANDARLTVGILRILDDDPRRSYAIRNGVAVGILPARQASVEILRSRGNTMEVLEKVAVDSGQTDVKVTLSSPPIRRLMDFDSAVERLGEFLGLPRNSVDPELVELLAVAKELGVAAPDIKQLRGARFEYLLKELLESCGDLIDSVRWGGMLDSVGIPHHAGPFKHDLDFSLPTYLFILEPTLAAPNMQQSRDVSVQDHVLKARGSLDAVNKKNVIGVVIVSDGFYPNLLRNLANDPDNYIVALTTIEFVQALKNYIATKNPEAFTKEIQRFHGRKK